MTFMAVTTAPQSVVAQTTTQPLMTQPPAPPLTDGDALKEQLRYASLIASANRRGDTFEVMRLTAKAAKAADTQRQAVANQKTWTAQQNAKTASGTPNITFANQLPSAQGGGNPNFVPGGKGAGEWNSSVIGQTWNDFSGWVQKCKFCSIFKSLEEVKEVWAKKIYDMIAPKITSILQSIMIFYSMIMAILIMTKHQEGPAIFKKYFVAMVVMAIVRIMLFSREEGGYPLAWIIIREIEISALKLGALIISTTAQAPVDVNQAGGLYAALTNLMEEQIWVIFKIAQQIMNGGSYLGVTEGISRAITALIMLLPYIFVIGIFLAFLVEAMFKFITISMLSPLLMPALIFGWSRAYVTASLRILLGAFLTIVFASMAMGFTVNVVSKKMNEIDIIKAESETAIIDVTTKAQAFCTRNGIGDVDAITTYQNYILWLNNRTFKFKVNKADWMKKRDACTDAWKPVNQIESAAFEVLGEEYFVLVIIGFISVLLHMQAKSLASNISGANDGAGAAAATVGAAKMALGAGMMYGSKSVFGGAKNLLQTGNQIAKIAGNGGMSAARNMASGIGNMMPGGGGSDPNNLRGQATQSPLSGMGNAGESLRSGDAKTASSGASPDAKKPPNLRS